MPVSIARSLWVAAALGAGCGNVMNSGAPDAVAAPDAAPSTPDAAVALWKSCADLAVKTPGAPSGQYTIDPDGPGGAAPLPVLCEMAVQGGSWTQLTETLAASLATNVARQYLYLYGSAGNVSPCTTDVWSWADGSGQELTGTYAHFDETASGTITCMGSTEKPQWGVGCSNGPSDTDKVLPIYVESPVAGVSEVCVTGKCELVAVIFEREGCTP